jgi:hypothetical protein
MEKVGVFLGRLEYTTDFCMYILWSFGNLMELWYIATRKIWQNALASFQLLKIEAEFATSGRNVFVSVVTPSTSKTTSASRSQK